MTGVQTVLFRSYLKSLEKAKRLPVGELNVNEADRAEDAAEGFDEEQLGALDAAWAKLGDDCKNLLRTHVYDGLQLKHIAQSSGEAEANVRKRKERCMDRLKTQFFHIYTP